VAADTSLAGLRADALRRAPNAPDFASVIEDAGLQRLAAYYVFTALIAGVVSDGDALAPARWPRQLAEPMKRMGLIRFAPRSDRGLDADLTASEQATRRSAGREFEFAQLAGDLINAGAFGPVCGEADSVRVVKASDRDGFDFEMLAGDTVVGKCKAEDHWELVAQQLASAPHGDDPLATPASGNAYAKKAGHWLKEHGLSHGIAKTTDLAVGFFPLGTAVGAGTRLVRSRIQTGRQEADALHRLGVVLRSLHAQADGELSRASR
jgi:hypothetical protein